MNTLPPISPETLRAAERCRKPLEAYGRACGRARWLMNAYCKNPTAENRAAVEAAMDVVSITAAEIDAALAGRAK